MSFLTDFADLLIHTITYEPVSSRNAYGVPSYGNSQSLKGRVTYKTRRIQNPDTGQEEVSSAELWVAPLTTINKDDRFTLPDGGQPKIIAWQTIPDETGNHHTKVFFGGKRGQ